MQALPELLEYLAANKAVGKGGILSLSKELKNDDPISKLCTALSKNTSVTGLDLSYNNITDKGASDIAKFLDKNKTIATLDLRKNKIGFNGAQAIQKALINNNITLTHIDLNDQSPGKGDDKESSRELRRVVKDISRMTEANLNMHKCLTGEGATVDMSGRGLTEISISFLEKYPNMQILNMNDNRISEIPEGITKFPLKELNLSHNSISFVPKFVGDMKCLTLLDLRHNKISTLPSELGNLTDLKVFRFASNKTEKSSTSNIDLASLDVEEDPDAMVGQVPVPKEVVDPDGVDLIAYMQEAKRGLRTQHRVKVMLLGPRGVGKTCMAYHLFDMGDKAERKSKKIPKPSPTHGVVRHWLEVKTNVVPKKYSNTVVVCLYDCGGDALSAESFISHRTVYMVVFNLLEPEEEKSRIEYYLHTIHKNVKFPVVVMLIGTHSDDKRCTSSYKKKIFQNMAQEWNERYPYLKHMTAIDAYGGKGIGELKERLIGYISSVNWLPQNIPRGYLTLEASISSKSYGATRPVMAITNLERAAVKCKSSQDRAVSLARFLTDLGVIGYSEPWIILDPSALSEAFGEVPYALRRQTEVTINKEPTNEAEAQQQLKSLLNESQELLGEYQLVLSVLKNEGLKRVKPPKEAGSSGATKKARKTYSSKSKEARKISAAARKTTAPISGFSSVSKDL